MGVGSIPVRVRWFDSDLGLLLLLGVLWGAAFPVIRLGLVGGAAPFPFAAIRWVLAAIVMAVVAAVSRSALPDRRSLGLSIVFGGGLIVAGYTGFLYWGEQSTPGGLSAVLIGTVPLASALLAYYILPAERFTWRGSLGIALGFVGLVVLFLPDLLGGGTGSIFGELAVVGAAVMTASGAVLLRRTMRTPSGLWTLTAQFATGAILLSILSVVAGDPLTLPPNQEVWLSLAYLVGISSVLGYWIYFRLLHRVGPARTSVVTYVNPLAGIAVGVLLLGESVGPFELAGFAVILGGMFLLQRDRLRTQPKVSSAPTAAR
ncbi:MAG: EamA family transporter [Thermoplasmata archaeon]|nr:EamA family transporter [Thermoplasmata archaeon]